MAEFYLQHRLSEDIDLFCEDEEVNQEQIEIFLNKISPRLGVKEIQKKRFMGLFSYHLIYDDKESLKVDFNYYPFPRIEKKLKYKNIEIDSLYDIAVNKIHTISTKPRSRDFIDIYFIVKEKKYPFDKMILDAKAKFDWHIDSLELATQLLKAKDVKDFPIMLKKINHRDWRNFFVAEAKKLEKDIFE